MNNQQNFKADSTTSLSQWLSHLESIHPSAIDMGLERVKSVADAMGIHLNDSLLITVAGTNGKGTTCRLLEQAMLAQGKTVAVFSSPHLVSYCERVRLNGKLAQEGAFCRAFALIEKARGDITLTYFEFGTLAAMKMMQDWGVDVAILEVGLGGRLDATNILDPDLAIVTTIDLDHQDWLGDTREKIAREKAGIMRKNGKAVIGELLSPDSLREVVSELDVDARWAQEDFFVIEGELADNSASITWQWKGKDAEFTQLPYPHIPLQNVSTALAALELLALLPDNASIKQIIANTRLPGRQQELSKKPLVVADVAHNPQATKAMQKWLTRYSVSKIRVVVGMLKDKSIVETLAPLSSLNAKWYLASTSGPRGCDAKVLQDALIDAQLDKSCTQTFHDVTSAYIAAHEDFHDGELILVFGSFVTVAEVLEYTNAKAQQ
ncbi:bifunctional tetrahydrofolate synthase/dihydrofolate synthase [Alteromonas sp. 1_MG-2023]|uniref:bifunctional tetrahydrofolate synthase/dihydrofolate synthase n=1 Tax=Alteromonas sp. 1_MG-2023 TaxID=3062669 RepID=UPI0026E308DA|nr:bifunctional tetrahydrofolate synthase/dihydrofolate synthase [Alteromonas sp. 1_MG-2023]MDO6569243.1 bifunctional tetrahydrofolate synthase/dihydrofolate synthase [Alteromonas sp. 1_MG-2023]